MTQKNISQYQSESDSVSLTKIDGKSFIIVKVEDSDYEEKGVKTKGVKIITKENFSIEGEDRNKFHTTRMVVVNRLCEEKVRADLAQGDTIGPMICKEIQAKKGGKPYFDLVEA